MPSVDLIVESKIEPTPRVRQLGAMFDVPLSETAQCEWHLKADYDQEPWQVGLILGPSGSGKTTVARKLFGDNVDRPMTWGKASVVDDFDPTQSMESVAAICQAVGFNTIPAWLRPFKVLSTGERFRVELGRRLLECPDPVVVDEFTSVVDRQVAQIGAHAVQKYVRSNDRQFVAITCHYDVLDWLQPDWILEPGTGKFARRSLQRRPKLPVEICRVDRSAWNLFAPFHYLTAEMHKAAKGFVLLVDGRPACYASTLHRPHPKTRNLKGISRCVTLPDWQGLGLAFVLMGKLGAAYKALGWRLHMYPAHPSFIRSMDRSKDWALVRRPASFVPTGRTSTLGKPSVTGRWGTVEGISKQARAKKQRTTVQGMRPCATFAYAGDTIDKADAEQLTGQAAYQ